MGEDRLAVLSQARPWAMSDEALLAGLDALHALVVEAQAALVRFTVEIDTRKAASKVSRRRRCGTETGTGWLSARRTGWCGWPSGSRPLPPRSARVWRPVW
jgi:hypothetical protein